MEKISGRWLTRILLFFFFFFFVCVCVRFIKIEKGILIVRVRFSFQTHSLRQIKWFYCSSRMSYSYVMNVPFLGGIETRGGTNI